MSLCALCGVACGGLMRWWVGWCQCQQKSASKEFGEGLRFRAKRCPAWVLWNSQTIDCLNAKQSINRCTSSIKQAAACFDRSIDKMECL